MVKPWSKLRVIAKRTLRDFWIKHSDCEEQLKSWYRELERSSFETSHAIKDEYPTASGLRENRIVFNIRCNKYHLIVKINFEFQICWIRFMGTHAEYDKIDANTI